MQPAGHGAVQVQSPYPMTNPKLSRYFFSTLGGIAMFGLMGFIVGPLVAALFLALLDIYSAEFLGRHPEGSLAAAPPALPELEGSAAPPPPGVETPG